MYGLDKLSEFSKFTILTFILVIMIVAETLFFTKNAYALAPENNYKAIVDQYRGPTPVRVDVLNMRHPEIEMHILKFDDGLECFIIKPQNTIWCR